MPEGPEVETDNLREGIAEEVEHGRERFLKQIALTTAVFAALASISALRAGATINEALFLRTEAARLQAQASDQWSFYQAKGIKAAVDEASRTSWLAMEKVPPAEYVERKDRYAAEQREIEEKAHEMEKDRDEKIAESEHLLHTHHGFAYAVAIFQVSIALGAVAALTRSRPVWLGSLALGASAIVLVAVTVLR